MHLSVRQKVQKWMLKSVAGDGGNGCAGGLIAPLTLQTENLIKCDTED